MKVKISSLLTTYIIFNQINFQEVFAQSSDETYKPFNDFYSIVGTAIVPLAVSILDKNNGSIYNLIDDLIIFFSIFLCPCLNVIENFDRVPQSMLLLNIILVGVEAIVFIFATFLHNINAISDVFPDNAMKSFYLE